MSALISAIALLTCVAAEPDLQTVRQALADRDARIRSVQATYSVWWGRLGMNPDNVKEPQIFHWTGQGVRKCLASETWVIPGGTNQRREWFSFDGKHAYLVWYAPNHTEYSFEIYKRKAIDRGYLMDAFLAFALGDSVFDSNSTCSVRSVLSQPNAKCVGLEELSGEKVVRLEVEHFDWHDGLFARLTVWLAPERDWWPKKVTVELTGHKLDFARLDYKPPAPGTNLRYHNETDKYIRVADSTNPEILHWFPSEFHHGRTRCVVDSVKINEPVTVNAFRPPMPAGVVFIDETVTREVTGHDGKKYTVYQKREIIGGAAGQEEYKRIIRLLQVPSPEVLSESLPQPANFVSEIVPRIAARLPDRGWLYRLVGWCSVVGLFAGLGARTIWRRLRT